MAEILSPTKDCADAESSTCDVGGFAITEKVEIVPSRGDDCTRVENALYGEMGPTVEGKGVSADSAVIGGDDAGRGGGLDVGVCGAGGCGVGSSGTCGATTAGVDAPASVLGSPAGVSTSSCAR